jgi:hypothetical protein
MFKSYLLSTLLLVLAGSNLFAQSRADSAFITKRNFISLNYSMGGGDYPCAGLGIALNHRLANKKTWVGLGAHYIGYTVDDEFRDDVQIFPIMLDLKHEFSLSQDGRFSTFVFLDGGYVVSITGNDVDAYGEFEYGNGWAINPGIAFKFNILRNFGAMLDVSWMHHTSSRYWLSPDIDRQDIKHWNIGLVRGSIFF